jgi:2,4-dienoyl-CoA reductase-like NADH-dependent reductase (Old Yellow Enzyme family)
MIEIGKTGVSGFPQLLSPLRIGRVLLRNRIVSTGHDTVMARDGKVTDQLIAYQAARAAGGVGLIVAQACAVHPTAKYTSHVLMIDDDSAIPGFTALAAAVHQHRVPLFAQLFHGGREVMEGEDGSLPVTYAPSSVPNERFHITPRAMPIDLIYEVITSYGSAAARLAKAGLDGGELVASHGYLPAQFLNPNVNRRTDEFGGSLDNRLRFIRATLLAIRAQTPDGFAIGMRISIDERSVDGLPTADALAALSLLDAEGLLDYVSVVAGSSSTLAGSDHIAPPMTQDVGYTAPLGALAKSAVGVPVIVTGRINQPQDAEAIIAAGQADAVGMTRAMICDPELGNKVRSGRAEEVRACIGCNQACIGHFHLGYPISCIQHPESGRELEYRELPMPVAPRRVIVVGGGPAGLKAAVVAAERGHRVTLYEAERRVGGQVRLAELLPGRSEFGGAITNLIGEAQRSGVEIITGTRVTAADVLTAAPDVVVVATGAVPRHPNLEISGARVIDSWDVVSGAPVPSGNIVVADWRCDWVGLGVATLLAQRGHRVTLAVSGYFAGQLLQQYVRDELLVLAERSGVTILPLVRPFGADEDSVYLQHVLTGAPVIIDDVAALVLAQGHESVDGLISALTGSVPVHGIGDALAPRTVEEAILEGSRVGYLI